MRILNNKFRKSLIRRKFKVITKNQGFVNGEVFYFVLDFDMERVLLQPANSLLQAAKKVKI